MSEHQDRSGGTDDAFFEEVRAAVGRMDPVPAEVVRASRAAFGWRSIDAELAALTYDSSIDERELAGVRGGGSLRMLCFETEEFSVDLQVLADGDLRTLIGELSPGQPATIEIFHPRGVDRVETDEHGRFRAAGVVGGEVGLRCLLAGDGSGRTVATVRLTL